MPKFARAALVTFLIISGFFTNLQSADAGYNFWKWLNFGSDRDSTDFTVATTNKTPTAPTLISPADASYTTDTTPELSVTYVDADTGDVGTTEYRIALSAFGCTNNTSVVASGSSAETSDESETTTWSASNSIGADGIYFWCARNNDGVLASAWTTGTGDGWSFTLDTTNPTTTAAVTAGTEGNASWYTTDATVTITPADATSGVASTVYCEDTTDSCTPATAYTGVITVSNEDTNYIRYTSTDLAGNIQTTQSLTVKVDKTAPVSGTVSHADAYQTATTIAVTVDAGSDANSGLSATDSDYLLEYRAATLADGTCGEYGEWTDSVVSETYNATAYDFTATTAHCYQFRYSVTDVAGNSATFTSTNTTKVDSSTPDIVDVDAGASAEDRVSLTSATWFKSSDTGSDDQVSFSWTDPDSVSDDTFYYELNSTATATITGDESSATTNYIDSITVAEGTNYFHVRPKNSAGTWGTERIFTVNYDKTEPTTTVTITETTYGVNFNHTATINGTAADAGSGVSLTEITIQESSTDNYWTGSAWTATETWVAVTTGTTTWTYTLDDENFTHSLTYTITARATDAVGNVTAADYGSDSFLYNTGNVAPNAPTLVSPANVSFTADTTPELSAHYSDDDVDDVGTTNYRVATSSENCLAGTVLASGTSAETSTNSEATTWSVSSSLGADGTYHWCAQNDDSTMQSAWTAMGSFILDATNPVIADISIASTKSSYFYEADTDLADSDDKIYFNSLTSEGAGQTITITISSTETNPDSAAGETAFSDTPTDLDDSPTQTLDYSIETDAATYSDLTVTLTDKATNTATYDVDFIQDNVDPTTAAAITSGTEGDASWYTTDVEVTLTPADATAGISTTVYCVDQADSCTPSTSYTSAVTISDNGTNYIRYFSTDNVGNIQTTQSLTVKLDKTTPDIVAVDAGAASDDRVSLTSATWFKYTDTGSDDLISFSWTDSASPSDDTFYYELNSTATATVTGDESSATTAYIDSIAIAEGSNYFHVRPQNVAGTWGTERIFTVNYDKTVPTGGSASTTDGYENDTTLAVTVAAGTDSGSGMSTTASDYTLEYHLATLAAESCGSYGSWIDASVSEVYDATAYDFTSVGGNCYQMRYTVTDIAGNEATWTATTTTKVDTSAPSTPSLSYTDGFTATTSQNVTFAATDGESGVANYTLYYRDATLAGGSCGSFGDWNSLGVQTSPYSHTPLTTAKCYQYKVTATNNAALASTKDDSTAVTKVDTVTPDILAVDAGSGTDDNRTSLDSDTWFDHVDTGSDDQISFSWDDPDSTSDDTFYYELNSTATATIDGTESSVATNYIDSITVAEGTNYFHVRPRNGSLTWGTERIFTVKYDKTDPTTSAEVTAGTEGDNSWYTTDATVTITPADATSGIASTVYCTDTANTCTPETAYTSALTISTEDINYVRYFSTDNVGNIQAAQSLTVKVDKTAAATGSTAHTDGHETDTTIAVTVSAGSDSNSGLSTDDSDYLLEYRSATLAAGTCGTYGDWTDSAASETAAATNYDFTSATGNCYQFRYTIEDMAGNSTTYTSDDTTKVDTSTPDIVAVDAGASSEDRVSLTSDAWFIYTDTGSDDQVSFSWTDPDSVSDDTFYYELNSTATATITGDESTVTTNYIDSITVAEGINYFHVRPQNAALTWGTERIFTVKYDKTDPTVETDTLISPNGGEIWTGGDGATYDIVWVDTDFVDATSDLTATPITIDYSVNSGTDWTEIATGEANDGIYTWTTPDLTDEEVQIRVTATDISGNYASDTSDADFRLSAHDNWIALYISEGNNQSGGMDATLTTDFKTRVGNGADSGETYAGADAVTVTFTVATTPTEPTAVGQSLADGSFGTTFGGTSAAKTVTTDADGYTSVVATLGDRAGDYTVIASFTNVETAEASRTFTATEREVFKFTISDPILSMDVDPMVNSTGSESTTLSVTTNAASYQINIDPTAWPTYDEETIQNWSGGFGFGWDNNDAGTSGGTSEASAFDGLDTPTDAYVCSGDTCQGTVEFTLDFHTAVDYSYEAGTYENTLTVEGANISF